MPKTTPTAKTLDELKRNSEIMSALGFEGTPAILYRGGDAAAFTGVSRYSARVKCALLGWVAMSDALILSGARSQEDA